MLLNPHIPKCQHTARSVLQHCPFNHFLEMIFLNEANSVKELIWTEMLRLRKTIPGRDKSMGPLILSVTLAALAYIISLHLPRQGTQTPGPPPPPLIDFFPLSFYAFCVTNIWWWWHTYFLLPVLLNLLFYDYWKLYGDSQEPHNEGGTPLAGSHSSLAHDWPLAPT